MMGAGGTRRRGDSGRPVMILVAGSLALASSGTPLLATREDTLPNGLRVVVHSSADAPVVSVRLLLPVGAAHDPPGLSGLAHLVEHLAFEGSARVPGNGYDEQLSAVGATNDASTSHDQMVYSVTLPPAALPLALFLEADRLGGLAPTARALANQQAVVANERAESMRTDLVRGVLGPLLWPGGHPYGRPVLGYPEELAAVRLADVEAFVARAFEPRGATLVVVGPIDPGDTLAQAARWFRPAPEAGEHAPTPPSAPTPFFAALPSPHAEPIRVWVPADVDRVRLRLGWRTFDLTHPDRVALELAGALLQDALRSPVAELETVSVNAWTGRLGGEFTVAADVERAGPMLRRIEVALARLASDGPPDGALERIRAMARSRELRGLQTAQGRAARLADCAERTGVADCLPDEWAARDAVDAQVIRRVVGRWLTAASRVLLAVAPASRAHPPPPRMTLFPGPLPVVR